MSDLNGKRDARKSANEELPCAPIRKGAVMTPSNDAGFDAEDRVKMLDKIVDAMESVLSRVHPNTAVANSMKQWADSNGVQKCVDLRNSYYCSNMDSFLASSFKAARAIQSAIHGDVQIFIVDSGCTTHCISDLTMFTNIVDDSPDIKVRVADSKFVAVKAVGDVSFIAELENVIRHKLATVISKPKFYLLVGQSSSMSVLIQLKAL